MSDTIQRIVDALSGKKPQKDKKWISDEEYKQMKDKLDIKKKALNPRSESAPSDTQTDQEKMDQKELEEEYSESPEEEASEEASPEEEDQEMMSKPKDEGNHLMSKPKRLFGDKGKGMHIMIMMKGKK